MSLWVPWFAYARLVASDEGQASWSTEADPADQQTPDGHLAFRRRYQRCIPVTYEARLCSWGLWQLLRRWWLGVRVCPLDGRLANPLSVRTWHTVCMLHKLQLCARWPTTENYRHWFSAFNTYA